MPVGVATQSDIQRCLDAPRVTLAAGRHLFSLTRTKTTDAFAFDHPFGRRFGPARVDSTNALYGAGSLTGLAGEVILGRRTALKMKRVPTSKFSSLQLADTEVLQPLNLVQVPGSVLTDNPSLIELDGDSYGVSQEFARQLHRSLPGDSAGFAWASKRIQPQRSPVPAGDLHWCYLLFEDKCRRGALGQPTFKYCNDFDVARNLREAISQFGFKTRSNTGTRAS